MTRIRRRLILAALVLAAPVAGFGAAPAGAHTCAEVRYTDASGTTTFLGCHYPGHLFDVCNDQSLRSEGAGVTVGVTVCVEVPV